MKHTILDVARDWLSLFLAGIGISVAPHMFFGGLMMSLAVGSLIGRKRESEAQFLGILATSGIVAVIALMIAQEFDFWGVTPQLIMIFAGAVSGWVVSIFVKVMDHTEAKSSLIADRVLDRYLPSRNKDKRP